VGTFWGVDRTNDPGQDPAEPSDEGGTSDVFGSPDLGSMGSFDWSQIPDDPDTSIEQSPTSRYPLHPDDRIWMHPSELQYLAPDAGSQHRSSNNRRLMGAGLVGAVVGAAVAALVIALIFQPSTQVVERIIEREITTANVSAVTPAAENGSWSVADIAAKVTPSVVRVEVLRHNRVISSGSGVIFRDDGHLITNAHVVKGGDIFRVVLSEGKTLEVVLVGADPRTDIAVLQPMTKTDTRYSPAKQQSPLVRLLVCSADPQ
jgi:hypothetical protein